MACRLILAKKLGIKSYDDNCLPIHMKAKNDRTLKDVPGSKVIFCVDTAIISPYFLAQFNIATGVLFHNIQTIFIY